MKIRTATLEDTSHLARLWNAAFQENEDFLLSFFSKRYRPYNVLLAENENNEIVSALHLIRGEVLRPSMGFDECSYIVGAATKEQERGKGYMSALLDYVKENSALADVFLFPADRAYYARRGYSDVGYVEEVALPAQLASVVYRTMKTDTMEMNRIYNDTLMKCGGLARDELAWELMMYDAQIISVEKGCCCGYAVVRNGVAEEALADDEFSMQALLCELAKNNVQGVRVIPNTYADEMLKGERKRILLGMKMGEANGEYLYIPEYY